MSAQRSPPVDGVDASHRDNVRRLVPWLLSPATTPTSPISGRHWVTSHFRRNSRPPFPLRTPGSFRWRTSSPRYSNG